jgi:tetratricopeptide (TPR) repeat protein
MTSPVLKPSSPSSIVDHTMTAVYYRDIAKHWANLGDHLRAAQFLFQACVLRMDNIMDGIHTEHILTSIDNTLKLLEQLNCSDPLVQSTIKSYYYMMLARNASINKEPTETIKSLYQQQIDAVCEAITLSEQTQFKSCLTVENVEQVLLTGKIIYKINDQLPMYQTFIDQYTHNQKVARLYVSRAMASTVIAQLNQKSYNPIDDLTKAIQLDNTFAEAYHRRAIYYKSIQDFEKSRIDYLKSAVITTPGSFDKCSRYYNGAMLLISNKDVDDDTLIRFLQLYDVALKEEKLAEMIHGDARPKHIWDYQQAKEICDHTYGQFYKMGVL